MKKTNKSILLVISVVLAIFGTIEITQLSMMIYNEIRYSDKKAPETVKTIHDFRMWQPSYTEAYKLEIRSSIYYIVTGDFARSMPSSKSEYYFDREGNYLAWNIDPGDFTTLDILSDKDAKRSKINIDEIGK